MATIINMRCMFTLTDEAAKELESQGLIYESDSTNYEPSVLPCDFPIYHVTKEGTDIGVGFCSIPGYIIDAERKIDASNSR